MTAMRYVAGVPADLVAAAERDPAIRERLVSARWAVPRLEQPEAARVRLEDESAAQARIQPVPQAEQAEQAERQPVFDLRAVRAEQAARRARQTPPKAPPGAVHFVTSDGWRWVHVDPALPGARQWTRLVASLCSEGPWESVRVRMGDTGQDNGHADFRRSEDGRRRWVTVTVKQGLSDRLTRRVAAHELAHVGDELVAWEKDPRMLGFGRRTAAAERFAEAAEEWVSPSSTAAELLAAAREFQAGEAAS